VIEVKRLVRVVSAVAVLAAAVLPAAYGASDRRPQSALGKTTVPIPNGRADAARQGSSFLSLWQPRAGRSTIVLEAFSLHDGRPLRTLEALPSWPTEVSSPHPGSGGSVWMTVSTGPRYRNNTAGGDPAPDSCTSSVVSFDPATGKTVTRLSFPRSTLVADGVPSPDGRRIVMRAGGCATSYFNQYLLVEDLRSGRRLTIGTDAAACHALSSAAWSPDGSKLVFAYGPATSSPSGQAPPAGICTVPHPSRLAVASATRSSQLTAARLISPTPGCTYQSAAFDRRGIVGIEACAQGTPPQRGGSVPGVYLGDTYLVQLDSHGRLLLRLALKLGSNPGAVVTDPSTGLVLVTEDQAQNQHHASYDWVWTFDGRNRHAVGRYPFDGNAVVTAEPW
jgi:hypothetical protein